MSVATRSEERAEDDDDPPAKPRKPVSKIVVTLLSCCLFLFIACCISTAALVLIGRHFIYNYYAGDVIKSEVLLRPKRVITRLPEDTRPSHYDIILRPDLEKGIYSGIVTVTLRIDSDAHRNSIVLHSKNLSIDTVDLVHLNRSTPVQVLNVEENELDEIIKIVTKHKLIRGSYNLTVKFSGSLLDKLQGFYRSQYKTKRDGGRRNIATSKFEPTYARQAFPCFDEPNMKATYTVHLLKPNDEDYIALSNMPVANSEPQEDGNILVTFEESVKMSTYLVCFIVSDFHYTEDFILPDSDNITFRVYATPEQLEKTNYANQIGRKVIEYYINYFGISFPLPKLDLAAIPDFVSGAMEHWGLVTFRETALLYSDTTHSSSNKQRVATVVSHELAHSWFGNLVTMDWWNDLWLNEGFASYIEYKGVDFAEPTWEMMDHFLISDLHSVLDIDSALSSHPIVQTVTTPDEITAIFDTISYNKGASILRMLEDAVGPEVFQHGVTNYLNAHKYGNAITQNLLNEIQTIVGNDLNVTEFMNTWTVQMGYPVVSITTVGNNYVLTQKRFLKDPDNEGTTDDSPYNYRWTIPITYITNINSEPTLIWFNYTDDSVTISIPTGIDWIKFNYKQVGYYRVNYETVDWNKLAAIYNDLSIADRAHLLEETFSLAEAGQLSYNIPLTLANSLVDENAYVPWSAAASKLGTLKENLGSSKYFAGFKEYVIDIVDKSYETLTWDEKDEDDHLTRLTRVTVLGLACSMGHERCLLQASDKLKAWLEPSSAPLSQDLRGLIYRYGMAAGTTDMWNQLWERFVAEPDANEKLKLLYGLASVRDTALLNRLLILAEDETYIRSQDYFTCLSYISYNPISTPIVWDYVRENWENLVRRFTLNDRYLGQLIPTITSSFCSKVKYEEMEAFFTKYPEAGAGESYRTRALESTATNIKWLEKYKSTVENWIQENVPGK